MKWTQDAIEALPLPERAALFIDALGNETPDAEQIRLFIVELDAMPRPTGGLRRNHPVVQAMAGIIRSDEGRMFAKKAAYAQLPALAGVDHMLVIGLGSNYGGPDTTSWAGVLVAEVMAEAGYEQTKKKPMPTGCVARTAAFFEPRASSQG